MSDDQRTESLHDATVTPTGPEEPEGIDVLTDSIISAVGDVDVVVHWFQRTTFESDE